MRSDQFRLDKWNLDCIADDGSVFIGYRAALHWHWLRLGYSSAFLRESCGRVSERERLRSSAQPRVAGETVAWSSRPLRLQGTWQPLTQCGWAIHEIFPGSNRRFSRLAT